MRRFTFLTLALVVLGLSGCVEGEQTFTLNPDGSGKVRIDVVMAPPAEFNSGPPRKEPPSVEGARLQSLGSILKAQGVVAWKDVSASFAKDGRFKFAGTAYFDKLENLDFPNLGPLIGSQLALQPEKDGALVLKKKPARNPGGPPTAEPPGLFGGPGRKSVEELTKLADADLDQIILGDRIQYQASRPLFLAFFSKGKVKSTYELPGAARVVKGFKGEGMKLVRELDGDKALAGLDAFFTRPDADLRGVYRKAGGLEEAAAAMFGAVPDEACEAVIPMPGRAQFDFAAEAAAARAAYPELRKALKVADDFWIPDGNPPPAKKGSPPR
jgi:hypothetical protein